MTRRILSRKAFIRLALLGGIGAGLATFKKLSEPIDPVSYLRWKSRGLLTQNFGKPAIVALESCPSYQDSLVEKIDKLWQNAEMPQVRGMSVLLKPNLVDSVNELSATTSPAVVAAAAEWFFQNGASQVIVADGPAFRRDAASVARQVKLTSRLEPLGVPLYDLNYDDLVPVKDHDGWFPGHEKIWLPSRVLRSDLVVSLAKMKTHHWAKVSLSLKNLLGIFPGAYYGWPKNFIHFNGIPQTILGIYRLLPNVVGMIDGVIGMEGDGPLFGKPIEHGVLAASSDLVALDMVCKDLMGFETWSVEYLNLAIWAGVGQGTRINLRGSSPEPLRRTYQPPPEI